MQKRTAFKNVMYCALYIGQHFFDDMRWDEYSNFLDKTTTILLLLLSKQFFGDIYEVSEKILGESNSKIHIGVS